MSLHCAGSVAGYVPPIERGRRAEAFNADPSTHIMLLTTAVGSLGLTLTGADVVVFVDHDWNPMKDLQVCVFSAQPRAFASYSG